MCIFFRNFAVEKVNMSAQSYISQLSPVLFRDMDKEQMDVERHRTETDKENP